MTKTTDKGNDTITVFYDGACPKCRRDRTRYEWLAGETGVDWLDITGQDALLQSKGIDPQRALRELHLEDQQGEIRCELDAYILLMARVPILRPLAWLISRPRLRPWLAKRYHAMVEKRLRREGRL